MLVTECCTTLPVLSPKPLGRVTTRRLVGAFGTIAVAQVLVRVRTVLMIPLMIKGFGLRDYGVWVLFVGTVSFLSAVLSLGMPQTLERFLAGALPVRDIRE